MDYIQNLGANAIWISPIVTNTDNGYHGFWLKDLYEINPHFGTATELHELIDACHSKNIWVMVDVVANHVGPIGFDYQQINPFNDSAYYHPFCAISSSDFLNNQTSVENCRLSDLPDLDQSNNFVRSTLLQWISDLIHNYGIDGLRLDTVPEVPKDFWSEFSQSAGVFTIGEIFDGRKDFIANYLCCIDSALNYPLYYQLKDVFISKTSMRNLEWFYVDMRVFWDQSALGNFVDNHDNPRFLSYNNDYNLFKNYILFNFANYGIPIIYYGSEQGFAGDTDPNNREIMWNNFNQDFDLYKFFQTIIYFRNTYQWYNQALIQRAANEDFYAFTRGNLFFAFTNKNYQIIQKIVFHPYNEGDVLCNLFYNTDCVTVVDHAFTVYLNYGETKIFDLKSSGTNVMLSSPCYDFNNYVKNEI